ncbi:MAG: malate dehydrogenase [Dehalococcoidia bacterium]|nr:MAG: malate dehydrogenase [Dehalococcoidia bacterium]
MKPSKITVIGAGNVGASLGQRLIEKDFADVVLLDIVEGLPQGKALDILESGPVVGFTHRISGSNNYADTAGSDVVVITSGATRKPGMSREDLLKINTGIVSGVVKEVVRHSPNCVIIVVANPVDAMTWVAYKASGFPRNRVLGLSGVLDGARLAAFIALECHVPVTDVSCYVLGEHGTNMVVFPRMAKVKGKPITELLSKEAVERLVQRAVNGGAEIVGLLKTASAFYAPSAAVARMVTAIMQDKKEILPCASVLDGEYGLKDVVIGVPVRLGRGGIKEVVDLKLSAEELKMLAASADAVKKQIDSIAL